MTTTPPPRDQTGHLTAEAMQDLTRAMLRFVQRMTAAGATLEESCDQLDGMPDTLTESQLDALGVEPGHNTYIPKDHPSGLGGRTVYRPHRRRSEADHSSPPGADEMSKLGPRN